MFTSSPSPSSSLLFKPCGLLGRGAFGTVTLALRDADPLDADCNFSPSGICDECKVTFPSDDDADAKADAKTEPHFMSNANPLSCTCVKPPHHRLSATQHLFALKAIPLAIQHQRSSFKPSSQKSSTLLLGKALFREIATLQTLTGCSLKECISSHKGRSHILPLLDVFTTTGDITLAFPYCPCDLQNVITNKFMNRNHLEFFDKFTVIKMITFQLLNALSYMHYKGLIHRDIKPGNILLTTPGENCRLVVADFGLSRPISSSTTISSTNETRDDDEEMKPNYSPKKSDHKLTAAVCTRWYRPPESLFSSNNYDFSLDMWAAGVVMCEMINDGGILFKGNSDIEQLFKVLQVVGDCSTIPSISQNGSDFSKMSFNGITNTIPLEHTLNVDKNTMEVGFWDVVKGLVEADPEKRWTADRAIKGVWFDRIRSEDGSKLLSALVDANLCGFDVGNVKDGERLAQTRRDLNNGSEGGSEEKIFSDDDFESVNEEIILSALY